jgi:hypothetical protein
MQFVRLYFHVPYTPSWNGLRKGTFILSYIRNQTGWLLTTAECDVVRTNQSAAVMHCGILPSLPPPNLSHRFESIAPSFAVALFRQETPHLWHWNFLARKKYYPTKSNRTLCSKLTIRNDVTNIRVHVGFQWYRPRKVPLYRGLLAMNCDPRMATPFPNSLRSNIKSLRR